MNFLIAIFIASGCGFISLSYEIIWFRAYSFVSWSSPVVFGLLLGFYLLGIAIGSLVSRRYCTDEGMKSDLLLSLAKFVFIANAISFLVIPVLAFVATFTHWWWSIPMVAIGAGCLGAAFPMVARL